MLLLTCLRGSWTVLAGGAPGRTSAGVPVTVYAYDQLFVMTSRVGSVMTGCNMFDAS